MVCQPLTIAGCTGLASLAPEGEWYPAPHRVPKKAGGTALRFAMVHDVLHQRYFRHGRAYYERRTELRQRALAAEDAARRPAAAVSAAYLDSMDDLAIGLEFTGRTDEGIEVLRRKLSLQNGPADRLALYRTHANLGTLLYHKGGRMIFAGKPEGRRFLEEGAGYLRTAIELNPDAHFGRESWQVRIGEYIRAVVDRPALLLEFDFVGNDMRRNPLEGGTRFPFRSGTGFGHRLRFWGDVRRLARAEGEGEAPEEIEERRRFRETYVAPVGAEPSWQAAHPGGHADPVPFDEPALAILGMWMLGGGPSPHFALPLGGILERVGETKLAWKAYERAAGMADRFWPDPAIREGLVRHCRARQAAIEGDLARREPGRSAEGHGERLRFESRENLARGEAYQRQIEAFEAERIAAGASVDGADFYAPFHAAHGSIASPPGRADAIFLPAGDQPTDLLARGLPTALLGAGVGGFLAALLTAPRRSAARAGSGQAPAA